MRSLLLSAVLGVTLLAPACANLNVGAPIDLEEVRSIVPGHTTQDDVLKRMGKPLHTVPGPDGEIFVYRHLSKSGVAQDLIVSFSGGRVSTFSYR